MIPISIDAMRGMKAKKDEDVRRFQVLSLIKIIYAQALDKASTTTELSYIHHCSPYIQHPPEISEQNITEVLASLRYLFPGCRVTHSTINTKEYIVVDWS
jgi:hypothetical protein